MYVLALHDVVVTAPPAFNPTTRVPSEISEEGSG